MYRCSKCSAKLYNFKTCCLKNKTMKLNFFSNRSILTLILCVEFNYNIRHMATDLDLADKCAHVFAQFSSLFAIF